MAADGLMKVQLSELAPGVSDSVVLNNLRDLNLCQIILTSSQVMRDAAVIQAAPFGIHRLTHSIWDVASTKPHLNFIEGY